MKTLRIVLAVLLGLFALPMIARLIGIGVALVRDFSHGATQASYLLGAFVGTLLVLAILAWLIGYLLKKNKPADLPPKIPGETSTS